MRLLRGKKVYLNAVEKCHLPARVEWINDWEIQRTLNFEHYPVSLAMTEKWFYKALLDPSRRDFSVFTIDEDKYVGFCSLNNIDRMVRKAEMHVLIGDKSYWRGGYGTEVYRLLVNYGFIELGLNKIYGYQLIHAHAAHRVVEKLGWKKDGLLRQDRFTHGEIVDRYVVSILKKDWEEMGRYGIDD